MIEPHAVLEVADGVLDLGVATVIGLQIHGAALAVGNEGVVTVGSEPGELGAGSGFHLSNDEPHQHGVGFALEGCVPSFCHVGGALQPVGDGLPFLLGNSLDEIAPGGVLPHSYSVGDTLVATGGDDGMGWL